MRFLAEEGWLAHYLDFSGERFLPPMPKLLEQPFWLDPSDPHRMRAAMQILTRPRADELDVRDPEWQLGPDLAGERLGQGRPPRRRRGRQPRAGGRRGDRPDQADPERVAGDAEGDRCRLRKAPHAAVMPWGGTTMRARAVVLAVALVLAPLGAKAADLVVWWDKGFYPQEDAAVREIIAAFEQKTGKQVELVQPAQDEMFQKAQAALEAGQPPDFLFGTDATLGRPVGLRGPAGRPRGRPRPGPGPVRCRHHRGVHLARRQDGRRGLYALPMGRYSNHVHVWNSLLERAGFTLADIPKQWEAFWSFWCDRVQPAVRKALGRDDIWGVGLPMSARPRHRRRAPSVRARLWHALARPRPPALRSTIPPCGRESSRR